MPMHDGQTGPPLFLVEPLDRSRGRGWWHRLVIWAFSRPRREYPW